MKNKRSLAAVIAFVLLLSALVSFSSFTAFADASRGIDLDCVYYPADSTLTVTASVRNPDTRVNTAMFVLDYDSTLLTTDASRVTVTSPAEQSAVYYSEGHVGADWYYPDGLDKSPTPSKAVTVSFTVKNRTTLDALEDAISVCDDTDYLNAIGGYGGDGGVLLCVNSSQYYNAAQSTATGSSSFREELSLTARPALVFDSVYSPDTREMTTVVSVNNQNNKVGAAMFVLKYDPAKLTPKATGSVSYLGEAKKSKDYANPQSGYIGADWFYDTALSASTSPTQAVKLVFDVPVGVEPETLRNALSICADGAYLSSINYGSDGGLLICETGNKFFNAADNTAAAAFNFAAAQPSVYTITVTDGSAKVGGSAATSAKAGETVTITANAAPSGQRFKNWEIVSGAPSLASTTAVTTTFTMPAANVSLKAVYEQIPPDAPSYTVTVTDGTAKVGGSAATTAKAGETVTITANAAPSGQRFIGWEVKAGGVTLADAKKATTTFTMPAADVTVAAQYGSGTGPNTSDEGMTLRAVVITLICAAAVAAILVVWRRNRVLATHAKRRRYTAR